MTKNLIWTKEIPTEEGYYWINRNDVFLDRSKFSVSIIWLSCDKEAGHLRYECHSDSNLSGPAMSFCTADKDFKKRCKDFKWAGPIPEPITMFAIEEFLEAALGKGAQMGPVDSEFICWYEMMQKLHGKISFPDKAGMGDWQKSLSMWTNSPA